MVYVLGRDAEPSEAGVDVGMPGVVFPGIGEEEEGVGGKGPRAKKADQRVRQPVPLLLTVAKVVVNQSVGP